MILFRSLASRSRPSFSMSALCVLLALLWLAGGASRDDAWGQVVVRGASWLLIVAGILASPAPSLREVRPILWFLIAALALPLLQLIPLPPQLWEALPGRDFVIRAAMVTGEPQPWRPWSMVPDATVNAASSLVVPFATLFLVAGLRERERTWLPGIVLALITLSMLIGLIQLSGGRFNNPFVNETVGDVSGMFANRNHFALFTAMGCLLAPTWAFQEPRQLAWRGPVALGLILLYSLVLLASGSRAGLALGGGAILLGLGIAQDAIRHALRRFPPWLFLALILGIIGLVAVVSLLSIAADRAVSVSRAIAIDPAQDMRSRGLPTVFAMIRTYFPFGSGLGSFDPIFRVHEPEALLKPTYFNHAHNDVLEIALDAGLPGIVLLVAACCWWAWSSARAWRAGASLRHATSKLGSAMLLLILLASLFDYPARTPLIMAIIIISGIWLTNLAEARSRLALPTNGQ